MPGVRTDLTAELQAKLKSVGAEGTPDFLDQALTDAVRAYSERRPRLAPLTIALAAGTGTYNLPEDLIQMEPASWSAATKRPADPVQMYDNPGYGRSGMFGTLRPYTGQIEADPPTTYEIYPGYPPTLVIDPAPTAASALKVKVYLAHALSDVVGATTVPKPDWGLITLRGVIEVWNAVIKERGIRPTWFDAMGDGNAQRIRMADPDALQKLADAAEAEWQRRIDRPMGVLG